MHPKRFRCAKTRQKLTGLPGRLAGGGEAGNPGRDSRGGPYDGPAGGAGTLGPITP